MNHVGCGRCASYGQVAKNTLMPYLQEINRGIPFLYIPRFHDIFGISQSDRWRARECVTRASEPINPRASDKTH